MRQGNPRRSCNKENYVFEICESFESFAPKLSCLITLYMSNQVKSLRI